MESDPNRTPSPTPRKVRFQPKPPRGRQEVLLGKKANDHQPQAEKKFVNADGSICDTNLYCSSDDEYSWDHEKSYCPITLPLTRPKSGDPEILDTEEFGAKAASSENDESATNAASKLGLLPDNISDEPRMIFFQIPKKLPLHRETPTCPNVVEDDPSGVAGSSASGGTAMSSNITGESSDKSVGGDLESLPAGKIGKLVVYNSGAVKLKIGDHLYEVSSGIPHHYEEVVAINEAEQHCSALGEIQSNAVVTLDMESFFKDMHSK